MKKLVTFLFILISSSCFAQGEANFWYFGQNAGLDFNSGNPVPLTNGQLNTLEGCASISDAKGNLLFYTDGTTVYNNTHLEMTNGFGLNGDSSSSQSAIIVPNPLVPNIYYIFTVDHQNSLEKNGLQYSTVDILENKVVSKNNPLINNTSEKITAVKSDDCNSYWVITYKAGRFYVYKVVGTGVQSSPIAGNDGFYANLDKRGYLKVSPDGTKIAIAHQGDGKLLLYDFNDATGIISNEIEIPLEYPNNKPYGVEFSPSGKRLYVHSSNDYWNSEEPSQNNIPTNHTSILYQIDLENTNVTSAAARTILDNRNLYRGALQLAPNGKIYRALSNTYNIGSSKLGVINNPEELGILCNYQHGTIDLEGRLSTQGLPPFIASLLLPIKITSAENNDQIITNQKVKLCVGNDYTFNAEDIPGGSYTWTHNNLPLSNPTSSLNFSNIQLSDSGIYELEVNLIDGCGFPKTYEGNFEIEVNKPPTIIPNIVYTQCDFDSDTIDGITSFNLSTKENELTNLIANIEVSFYEANDITLLNPLDKSEYRNNNPFNQTLIVKVENTNTGCSSLGTIDLLVFQTSLDSYPNVYTCEIDSNKDDTNAIKSEGNGYGKFDFDKISNDIKSFFTTPVIVKIYNNSIDASLLNGQINGIHDFEPKEVFVRIENETTNSCLGGGTLNLIINQLPIPNGSDDDIILCVSNPRDNPQLFTTPLNGETGNVDDTYQWFFNENIIPDATNSTFDANAEGIYKVEVARNYENNLTDLLDNSYCVGYNTFKVIESNPAIINQNDITITDDSDNNTITISTANLGLGTYEYSLIDYKGNVEFNYQNLPFFNDVPAGIHTILIKDINCNAIATHIEVSVIGYPGFFTPNNDGVNDYWKVLGVNENFYVNSNIFIFNRFGKLITQIDPKGPGWNGIFNGNYLPASDYWFSVELIDRNGTIKIKKGHFSLIRR